MPYGPRDEEEDRERWRLRRWLIEQGERDQADAMYPDTSGSGPKESDAVKEADEKDRKRGRGV